MWGALIFVLATSAASADKPPQPPACDAAKLEKAGDEAWATGEHWTALDQYEKAVRCELSETRALKAGFAVCEQQRGFNEAFAAKAKRYYDLLERDDDKQKLAQFCTPRCRLEY
jgi:hypothetical protein